MSNWINQAKSSIMFKYWCFPCYLSVVRGKMSQLIRNDQFRRFRFADNDSHYIYTIGGSQSRYQSSHNKYSSFSLNVCVCKSNRTNMQQTSIFHEEEIAWFKIFDICILHGITRKHNNHRRSIAEQSSDFQLLCDTETVFTWVPRTNQIAHIKSKSGVESTRWRCSLLLLTKITYINKTKRGAMKMSNWLI